MGNELRKEVSIEQSDPQSIIKKFKDRYNEKSKTGFSNQAKGFKNKNYIDNYKDVIQESFERGISLREIYTLLNEMDPMDMSQRTFYRWVNNLLGVKTQEDRQDLLDVVATIVKEEELKPSQKKEVSENRNSLNIRESNLTKSFQHDPEPNIDDLV